MNANVGITKEEVVKTILADILEIEPDELTDEGSFIDEYGADSLRAVEILAMLEKEFSIRIPEAELPHMSNFKQVIEVLARNGW